MEKRFIAPLIGTIIFLSISIGFVFFVGNDGDMVPIIPGNIMVDMIVLDIVVLGSFAIFYLLGEKL